MIISVTLLLLVFTPWGQTSFTPSVFFKCQPPSGMTRQSSTIGGKNLINDVLADDYVASEFGVYKIHKQKRNWNDARNICVNENAQLIIIDTVQKETLILNQLQDHNMTDSWIGVHDMFREGDWTTVRGDKLNSLGYVHWAEGEPNNAGANEHCLHISQRGLNDLRCTTHNFFICERLFAMWKCKMIST